MDIARFTLISNTASPILYMDFAKKRLEIELVAKFFNDEDYDTMKPYIALTDKTRKKCMEDNFKM